MTNDQSEERSDMERNQEHLEDAKMALRIGQKDEITGIDREWLKDKMEEMAGTRNLKEANRRMDVVWEWRLEE